MARHNLRILRTSFLHSRAGLKQGLGAHANDIETGATGDTAEMAAHLQEALDKYHAAHTKALRKLYRHFPSALNGDARGSIKSFRAMDSRPYVPWPRPRLGRLIMLPVTYSNEEVLIIYFYCFHLEEFAKEEVSTKCTCPPASTNLTTRLLRYS